MHTIYPQRTTLASFHVRPLNATRTFILLCCNGANPFEAIAKAVDCTHKELHIHLFYLLFHGLLMPMIPERWCAA